MKTFIFILALFVCAPAFAQTHKGATFPLTQSPLADCSQYFHPQDADKFSHCQGMVEPSFKWFFTGLPVTSQSDTPRDPRATYPLTNIFLPDCSLYIDPKDAEMYSHCERVNTSFDKKWHGYVEFIGKPGTRRSLGQTDLFIPLVQDENDMTFFNVRGHVDFGNDNSEYNLGVGHRHMFDKFILGAYAYYDQSFTELGNRFKQITMGVEALSETWDFRANGYIPENHTHTIKSNAQVEVVRLPRDQIKAQITGIFQEKALPGWDVEVGYKLPITKLTGLDLIEDTRVYLGGYHFLGSGNFDSVTGPRVRLETKIHGLPLLGAHARLTVGIESQYDDPRGSNTTGKLGLRIPFGVGTERQSPLKGLDRRMMDPVVRDIDIVAPQADVPVEMAPVFGANGKEVVIARDIAEGTSTEMFGLILDSAHSKDADVLFVVEGPVDLSDEGLNIRQNQIIASAAKEIMFTYKSRWLGDGRIGYTKEGTPFTISGCSRINAGDNAQINGWTKNAAGCDYGFVVDSDNDYILTNSTVFGATEANIKVSSGTLHVDKVGLHGSDTGVLISGTGKLRGVEGTVGTIGYTEEDPQAVTVSYYNNRGELKYKTNPEAYDQVIDFAAGIDESLVQVKGVSVDATGYNTGLLVDKDAVHTITDSSIFNAWNQNVHLTNGTLYVNELGLYGTDIGVLITNTGKLRGFDDTDGTLGFGAIGYTGTAPEDELARFAVIKLQNVATDSSITADVTGIDNLDNLDGIDDFDESHAQVARVIVDGTGYKSGIRIQNSGTYFIDKVTAKNVTGKGNNRWEWTGTDWRHTGNEWLWAGGISIDNAGANVYLRNSATLNNRWNGVMVTKGKLFASGLNSQYNGWDHGSGLNAMGTDSYAYIKASNISNGGVHGLNAVEGGTIFATGMTLNNNKKEGADSNSGGSYIYISDSTLSGNAVGLLVNRWSSGQNPNEIYVERVTIANSRSNGAHNSNGRLTIKDSKITGSGGVGVASSSTFGGYTVKNGRKKINNEWVNIYDYVAYQHPAETTLVGVEVTGGSSHGITSSGGDTLTLTGVTVTGNKGYGIKSTGASYTYGILKADGTVASYEEIKSAGFFIADVSVDAKNNPIYTDATRGTVDAYNTINIDSTSNISGNESGDYLEGDHTLYVQDTGDRDEDEDITEYYNTGTRNGHFGRIIINGVECDLTTENADCQPYQN